MDKIRLGVIGTGAVVREIYQYLFFHSSFSHLLSIEAAADPNEKALAEFCDRGELSRLVCLELGARRAYFARESVH